VLVAFSALALTRFVPERGDATTLPSSSRGLPDLPGWVDPTEANDSSGHHNDGVILGEPVRGVPGHRGTAYAFSEPGSFVSVPGAPSLNPGQDDFMYAAWVRLGRAPGAGHTFDILRKGLSYTSTGMYKVEVVEGGRARCTAKDTERRTARITSVRADLADQEWHRIGCARIGGWWVVVVDDVTHAKRVSLGSVTNGSQLSIGSKYGEEDFPRGSIDDVVLFVAPPPRSSPNAHDLGDRLGRLMSRPPAARWRLNER
jgi:hypothetical protein